MVIDKVLSMSGMNLQCSMDLVEVDLVAYAVDVLLYSLKHQRRYRLGEDSGKGVWDYGLIGKGCGQSRS